MPIDPFRDYTYEEQRQLDLGDLFEGGIRGENGGLTPLLQGVGAAATAIQAEAAGVPVEMMGRIAYTAAEIRYREALEHPEELTEELDKRGFGRIADILRAGLHAVQDETDYRALARWIANVHVIMRERRAHGQHSEN
jgi:hypothetical protein